MPTQADISALEEKYRKLRQEILEEYPSPMTHSKKEERDKRLADLDDQHAVELGALYEADIRG